MTFTWDKKLKGTSYMCDAVDYQIYHSLESLPTTFSLFSSAIFTHKDPFVKDNCGGKWFRKSGSMKNGQSWKWSDLGEYDGKIYSFKIANFKTSTGDSGSSQLPPDPKSPHIANCRVICF
ncbi:hypothetical protein BJ944DRAFT_231184 [Cunninghamella echinulata]|nr:hypothetical protein BJ944DRAFT_231184 [Cunninghamella echinulata]